MPALIGALRVSLSADTAAFHSGMKRAEVQARSSGTAISKSLGLVKAGFVGLASGLSIGLITRGIKAGLDYAGSLGEISQQLGVTTRDLQVFRFAAGQVGVKQEQLETGLSKLTITLGKVAAGAKAPIAALNAIGISVDQLKGKDTGEAFRIIADGLQKVTDRSQRAAIEVALFGKSGAQLDTLLSGGSAAINELSLAAERLGIVLSDEQIQKADETADKLDALQTVLSAQIAGTVADNADAILTLANALITVAGAAGKAIGQMAALASFIKSNPFLFVTPAGAGAFVGQQITGGDGNVRGLNKAGKSVTIGLPSPKPKIPAGADVGQFLAGGGGGGRKRGGGADDAERKRLEALRDAFQFEEEQRRADMDILRAKQQLATDYVERTALSIQMLNLEKDAFEAELLFRMSIGELEKPQADILRAKFAINDALQRQIVLEEEEADRLKDYNRLDALDLDLKREQLESQAQLAETASERRAIELRILDIAYAQEQQAIDELAASKDWADQEEARRRQLALNETFGNDRAAVIAGTRGPMEDWLASLPTTAAKAQEALERLQVDAFEGLIDAAVLLTEGFDGAKDALLGTLKSFLQGLLRMQLQKGLASILGNSGIIPGFAFGGFTGRTGGIVHANEFVLNAAATSRLGVPSLEALNRGAPLSAVSNDNSRGGVVVNQYITTPNSDSFSRNQRQIARDTKRGLAIQ